MKEITLIRASIVLAAAIVLLIMLSGCASLGTVTVKATTMPRAAPP